MCIVQTTKCCSWANRNYHVKMQFGTQLREMHLTNRHRLLKTTRVAFRVFLTVTFLSAYHSQTLNHYQPTDCVIQYLSWQAWCRHPGQQTGERQRDLAGVWSRMQECLRIESRRPVVSHEILVCHTNHLITRQYARRRRRRFRIDIGVRCVGAHPPFWPLEPARVKPN